VVNIPVENGFAFGHSQTHFQTEDLRLSHGDDPYIGFDDLGLPARPHVADTLVPSSMLAPWSASYGGASVGLGIPMAMIRALSGRLLLDYCEDVAANVAPGPNSAVVGDLTFNPSWVPILTVAYLDNLPPDPLDPADATLSRSLWDRLAGKVASLGGCGVVNTALTGQFLACESITPPLDRPGCSF
jgi:hypothetical protein